MNTILAKDTFTDVNGTLLKNHVPDIGIAYYTNSIFNPLLSDIIIFNNQAQWTIKPYYGFGIQAISDGGNDSYVKIKNKSINNNYIYLHLRCTSLGNIDLHTIRAFINNHTGFAQIVLNNVAITAFTPLLLAVDDILQLSVTGGPVGATITLSQNGVNVISVIHNLPINQSGFGGFGELSFDGINPVYVDDFEYGYASPFIPPPQPKQPPEKSIVSLKGEVEIASVNDTIFPSGQYQSPHPILTYDFNRITGIITANATGVLTIFQTNDQNREGSMNVVSYPTVFNVIANTPLPFDIEVIAPMLVFRFLNTSFGNNTFTLKAYGKTK